MPGSNLSLKISVMGDTGVGKSSILRRFVQGDFDERPVATIGVTILVKEIRPRLANTQTEVTLKLSFHDIMGSHSLRELLQRVYFYGAHGALAVCDVTRPETFSGLKAWLEILERVAGAIPVVILANKADLVSESKVAREQLEATASELGCPFFLTSAKTGENIREAMKALLSSILKRAEAQGKDLLEMAATD